MMIIILDDTFSERKEYNDISYLQEDKYKAIFKIYEYPKKKVFREILKTLDDCKLFCNHRSLKLYDDNNVIIDGREAITIQNLFSEVLGRNITRIEFGRDMHTNFDAKTIDKSLFYSNLKSALDYYTEKGEIELKVLYYGENYHEIEKLTLLDKVIDKIYSSELNDIVEDEFIKNSIEILIPQKNSSEVIKNWINKDFSKKEIREFLNKNI